jgi:hypothetical protein
MRAVGKEVIIESQRVVLETERQVNPCSMELLNASAE